MNDSFDSTKQTNEDFRYFEEKGLSKEDVHHVSFEYYQGKEAILVPIKDMEGNTQGGQYIFNEGGKWQKRYKSGLSKTGNFLPIVPIKNEEGFKIFVAEGYATAVSLQKLLDDSSKAAVVWGLDSQSIPGVAKNLSNRFDYAEVIAAPDADEAGNRVAVECKDFGIHSIFPPKERNGYDWNDVIVEIGMEKGVEALNESLRVSESEDKSILEDRLIERSLEGLDDDPCRDFSMDNFPDQFKRYIESLCETTEAHPIMIAMSAICEMSSFISTKAYVSSDDYYQDLYCNIWSLCVSKSGNFKSTALNKGSRLAIEKERSVKKKIKDLEMNFESMDAKPTEKQLKEHEKEVLSQKIKSPILPSRVTTEYFMGHLSAGHKGQIMASEVGEWLKNLEKSHNGDLKAVFTNFYDCNIPPYSYCTKSSGEIVVERPYITLNAVSTVDWVKSHIKSEDVFSGFFARMLLFCPPSSDGIPEALPVNGKDIDSEAEGHVRSVIDYLEGQEEHGMQFQLSEQGKVHFNNLHAGLYRMVQNNKEYGENCQKFLEPYLKRWSPYLLKLGMIFSILEDPKGRKIDLSSLKAASDILSVAIKSTAKLFQRELGETKFESRCRKIFEWLLKHGAYRKAIKYDKISSSRLISQVNSRDILDALDGLESSGYVECFNKNAPNKKNREYRALKTKW